MQKLLRLNVLKQNVVRANSYQNHKLASSGAMNQYVAGGENASLIYVTLTVLYEESELTR